MSTNGVHAPKVGVLHPWVLGATKESWPLFRCPGCGEVGYINQDQFHGMESVECPMPRCGYQGTNDWSQS